MKNSSIFSVVESDLALVETELLSVIQSPVETLSAIGSHLTKAGGKRLRPALYLLCAKNGCTDTSQLMPVAVAIEMIHMATLVHDDVIDFAETRRGIPTANIRWGNHSAVLSGDFLFAKAFSLLASYGNPIILKNLTDVVCSLCEGEILQIKEGFNMNQAEADYLIRIGKKTADFIAVSSAIGGMSAGMDDGDVEALRQYGYSVGMAFQITDDILDYTASSQQLGKPAGNDLRQGIVTLPAIYAMNHSSGGEELRQIIGTRDINDTMLKRALTIVHSTEAIEYSYAQVGRYLEQARNVLPLTLNDEIRQNLLAVADFVGLRKY